MTRIEPKDNQINAHAAILQGLEAADRTQVAMACGSGKTFTQAFLARHVIEAGDAQAPIIACFVPNRELIYQNAVNFHRVFGADVDFLGVCSADDTKDAIPEAIDAESAAFRAEMDVTTDKETIRRAAASRTRPLIVFSTYQSAKTFRDGICLSPGVQEPISLGLMDEAHRTAGEKTRDSQFAFSLFDDNIVIAKRAFFTATPRVAGSASDRDDVISMDDPSLYGERVYQYPFSQGIRDGNLVDYKLFVPFISQSELSSFMNDQGFGEDDSREAVAELALMKVMEETGQSRFLTYHADIDRSKSFASRMDEVLSERGFTTGHIDGTTEAAARARLLGSLASGKSVVSNCKALVEGVDSPGLQGVMFVDPKGSVVDIIQAMGRASRPDPNDKSKVSSIIAPVVVSSTEIDEISAEAREQGFGSIINVALALSASDDMMMQEIRSSSREAGRAGDPGALRLRNIEVLGLGEGVAVEDVARLERSISMLAFSSLKDSFSEKIGQIDTHVAQAGSLPTTKSDPRLYAFMTRTRKRHAEGRLQPEEIAMAESVEGWSWLGPRAKTEEVASHVEAFISRVRPTPDLPPAAKELERRLWEAERTAAWLEPGVPSKRAASDIELARELDRRGALFRSESGGSPKVSGSFQVLSDAVSGEEKVYFRPSTRGAAAVPIYQSGQVGLRRAIRVHLEPEERARVDALPKRHEVDISLARAGKEKAFQEDGRVLAWGEVRGRRQEGDIKPGSVRFVLNRLSDRVAMGLEPITISAVRSGRVAPNAQVVSMAPGSAPLSNEDLWKQCRKLRRKGAKDPEQQFCYVADRSPGFSWLDPDEAQGFLKPALEGIVARHGKGILSDPRARHGNTGLSNTLRAVDSVLAREELSAGLRAEIGQIPRGYRVRVSAARKAEKKIVSAPAHSANMSGGRKKELVR